MIKYITATPGIMSGDPVIAGIRIPIARIIYLLSQGYIPKHSMTIIPRYNSAS